MSSDCEGPHALRVLVARAGVVASILFVIVGPAFHLQTYGDGSIFSYAVAVRDVWAFHWHNIATRLAVYGLTLWPGEWTVALTGDPGAGVFVYGLCLFSAQALGLAATRALDRTPRRLVFAFACASTALAAPVVFGFPTEMWIAHALFWPAFACAWSAPRTAAYAALLLVLTIALALAHEGGLLLAFGIAASLSLRGVRDPRFLRAAACFVVALAVWLVVNAALPPDSYFGEVRLRAASEFFEARIFESPLLLLVAAALAGYGALYAVVLRMSTRRPERVAAAIVALALVVYWVGFDRSLHADNRYYLRTVLLLATCVFAAVCAFLLMREEDAPVARLAWARRVLDALSSGALARALAGAVALVLVVHVVETAKFVVGWSAYRGAVRALATGATADPQLGAPYFVSSRRIPADLNRLSWFSTTPYLSALVAGFQPKRLVIDPAGNYFWLSCATATANATAARAVPVRTREMIRFYSCLHRK